MSDAAAKRFRCTGRDRALFEAGIKLGAAHHQFVGAPVNESNAASLERAVAECARVQPFVVGAEASIDRRRLRRELGHYGYTTLTGELLRVSVTVECEGWRVRASMRHLPDIDYPLMFVESVAPVRKGRR